jgi:NADH-quinone oxidoreductase subunit H
MDLGWKVLIPLALGWLLLITAFRVGDDEGWNPFAVAAAGVAVFAVCYLLLTMALRAARRTRALDGEVGA